MSTSKPSGLKGPSKIGRPTNAGVTKTSPSVGKRHFLLLYIFNNYNINNFVSEVVKSTLFLFLFIFWVN